jgi:hypothetical protein
LEENDYRIGGSMAISTHLSVISKINEISFEEDCEPDSSFFVKYFSTIGSLIFSSNGTWTTGEKSSGLIFSNRAAFRWLWNNNKATRIRMMDNFHSIINTSEKNFSKDVRSDIIFILDQVFDSLESGKDFETERIIIDLNMFVSNKKSYLKEYSKYKLIDSSLGRPWKDSGMENSKEPEFFELTWSELKRSSGYVDSQKKIIAQCSKNCKFIPDQIVESLGAGGYDSVKGYLVRNLCEIASWNKSRLSSSSLTDLDRASIEKNLNRSYAQIISIVPNIKSAWEFSPDLVIETLPKEHLVWVAQQIRDSASRWTLGKLEEKLTS